jgi:hypothetical protein
MVETLISISIPTTGNTQEANLTGYLSKLEDLFITQLSLALL